MAAIFNITLLIVRTSSQLSFRSIYSDLLDIVLNGVESMNILLVDDNKDDMKDLVDLLRLDHTVWFVCSRQELEKTVLEGPALDAIILDLMMADTSVPDDESDDGYTAGLYLYEHIIAPVYGSVPFIVLTGVDTGTGIYVRSIERLRAVPSYRGSISKPAKQDAIIALLKR